MRPSLASVTAALARLVAFDTTSHRSNLELIAWAEAQIAAVGGISLRVPDATGQKANLWARIGPDVPGGVVLAGHTDVVPVAGQAWSSNPFTLTPRDGRLYGRGTADMKGFVALVMACLPQFAQARLARPLYVALTYDEEVGCVGVGSLIQHMRTEGCRPEAVIVGEPTHWAIVDAHKSIDTFWIEATGLEAHSSRTDLGISAVMALIPVLARVRALADSLKTGDPSMGGRRDSRFTPDHATLGVGEIEGGTAVNILARRARFSIDLRTLPGQSATAILEQIAAAVALADAELKAVHPDCGAVMWRRAGSVGLDPEPEGAAERLARKLTGANATEAAAYAAEAGQFQKHGGYSTVLCGPGSIAQAHAPDEWIAVSELERGLEVMDRLAAHLSTPLGTG
jgi:acetylornithine deacetylase